MSMNEADLIFNKYHPEVGKWGGELFDILRPDYSVIDNNPAAVASNLKYRCSPSTDRYAEPAFQGVQYYDIFGPRNILLPGDVLQKSTDDGMTPRVTISHYTRQKTIVGFRTSRVCKITNAAGSSPVYENVYFEFLGIAFPGQTTTRKIEDSLRIPNTRIVMYKRENITRLRMHLIETDGSFERKWLIANYEFSGNLMILTVDNV